MQGGEEVETSLLPPLPHHLNLHGGEEVEASLLPSLLFHPNLQGEEEAEASLLPPHLHPHPLKIIPCLWGIVKLLSCNQGPCLFACSLMATSPAHPYTVCDPNAPHIIMTFSLPNMLPSVSYNDIGIVAPTITTFPPNPYSWTLLPLLTWCPISIRVIRFWGAPPIPHRLWC